MMNLFSALELSKNSMMAHQQVFQIIGHNIANVNTEGYSRQTPVMESVPPEVVGYTNSGRGVNLAAIESVRDSFIIDQIAFRNQFEGKYQALTDAFASVEALFNESNGYGLSDVMTNFFNSWSELSGRPDDIPTRQTLGNMAKSMTDLFNRNYFRLIEQQEVFNSNIKDIVDNVNALAQDIAGLNEKISYAAGTRSAAFDLMDERDRKVKQLSELVGINSYVNQTDNTITVEIAGRPLVHFNTVNQLSVEENPNNSNYYDINISQYGGTPVNITGNIENGRLEALLLMRDTYIPSYKQDLDDLAAGLILEVNNLHQQGFALDGYTTGLNFFDMASGPGTINAGGITGTTITISGLAGNISNTLAIGDVISINGQTRMVTNITDPNQFTVDSAFNNDPLDGAPATWSVGYEYFNRDGAASLIEVESNLLTNPELIAASGNIYAGAIPTGGGGTVLSVGNNLTFTMNILSMGVREGTIINAGGQFQRIVAIASDGLSAVTQNPFAPSLPGGSAWTYQNFSGAAGDNGTALNIFSLMNQDNVIDQDRDGINDFGTFHDYLHSTFSKIGNDSALSEYELNSNKSMLQHLENKRDEISGVSLDEEAANLVQFEKSFQAIAQFFGLINELTDVLISMTG